MGIFMEGICHYRDCESFFLFCYSICIHARHFYNSLDPNCYRNYMLLGCFDCAQTYSPTSALMPTAIASLANPMSTSRWRRQSNYTKCYKLGLIIAGMIFILFCGYCSHLTAVTDRVAITRIIGETR